MFYVDCIMRIIWKGLGMNAIPNLNEKYDSYVHDYK